ncbi:MAG: hypothetical protein M1296_07865 [Chloroflexi bacterium]|nr:hypothetical protein [Chloroflexota bacterium]
MTGERQVLVIKVDANTFGRQLLDNATETRMLRASVEEGPALRSVPHGQSGDEPVPLALVPGLLSRYSGSGGR